MKHFSKYYLCEALSTEATQWLKSVIDTQKALADENNFNPIEIDINKLNKPRNPFTYEDFFNDAIVKNILNDKKVGFVITNQMVRNSKNFIETLNHIVKDIREMCNAEFCCILVVDKDKEEVVSLAEDRVSTSNRKKMGYYINSERMNEVNSAIEEVSHVRV